MKTPTRVRLVLVALASAIGVPAQSSEPPVFATPIPCSTIAQLATTGRTAITLVTENERAPFVDSARVTVPIRVTLLVTGPDSDGRPYARTFSYIVTPIPLPPDLITPEKHLAHALASSGAFPIPAGTLDVVYLTLFTAGAYTAQVTSGDKPAGEVLLEIYEVP